jgi:hypothetical protein
MSHYNELRAEVLDSDPQHGQSEIRWLEPGDEVEVLWTDAQDKPHVAIGELQGTRVPAEGGPSYIVLDSNGIEVELHTEDVVGITPLRNRAP